MDPSQDMKKEIDKIKNEKENIFTKIYDSFFPGQKQLSKKKNVFARGGLSTRRKRKRRPKFHQVRSYKQRPKQQHKLK